MLVTGLRGRKLDARAERVLFALVANRAIEPSSKLAATSWVGERVAIDGLDAVDADVSVGHRSPRRSWPRIWCAKGQAAHDPTTYQRGVKVTNAELAAVPLHPHDWHGEWNYP